MFRFCDAGHPRCEDSSTRSDTSNPADLEKSSPSNRRKHRRLQSAADDKAHSLHSCIWLSHLLLLLNAHKLCLRQMWAMLKISCCHQSTMCFQVLNTFYMTQVLKLFDVPTGSWRCPEHGLQWHRANAVVRRRGGACMGLASKDPASPAQQIWTQKDTEELSWWRWPRIPPEQGSLACQIMQPCSSGFQRRSASFMAVSDQDDLARTRSLNLESSALWDWPYTWVLHSQVLWSLIMILSTRSYPVVHVQVSVSKAAWSVLPIWPVNRRAVQDIPGLQQFQKRILAALGRGGPVGSCTSLVGNAAHPLSVQWGKMGSTPVSTSWNWTFPTYRSKDGTAKIATVSTPVGNTGQYLFCWAICNSAQCLWLGLSVTDSKLACLLYWPAISNQWLTRVYFEGPWSLLSWRGAFDTGVCSSSPLNAVLFGAGVYILEAPAGLWAQGPPKASSHTRENKWPGRRIRSPPQSHRQRSATAVLCDSITEQALCLSCCSVLMTVAERPFCPDFSLF